MNEWMNGQMDGGMTNIITSIKESIGQSIYSLASQSINQSTNPWASQLEKQSVILIDWLTGWLADWKTGSFVIWFHDPLKLIAQSVQNQANLHSCLAQINQTTQMGWQDYLLWNFSLMKMISVHLCTLILLQQVFFV